MADALPRLAASRVLTSPAAAAAERARWRLVEEVGRWGVGNVSMGVSSGLGRRGSRSPPGLDEAGRLVAPVVPPVGIASPRERYPPGIRVIDTVTRGADSRHVRIGVLGPLEIDERTARLGSRDRIVLSVLAMSPGRPFSPEELADAVWGDDLPASWSKNLQGCISRLRKRLGSDHRDVAPGVHAPAAG